MITSHETLVTSQRGYKLISLLQAYTVPSLDTLVTSQSGYRLVLTATSLYGYKP